jgi:hypothetical protein
MKSQKLLSVLLTSTLLLLAGASYAQPSVPGAPLPVGPSASRSQIKMERDEFLRTHNWNETSGLWTLREGVEVPAGVKSRDEVKTERDKFLRNNRWTEAGGWAPVQTPRNTSTMSSAQLRVETKRFMATHVWDEIDGMWLDKAARKAQR